MSPDALRHEPLGSSAWVQIAGSSMSPLLESGDFLHVRRCDGEAVRRADIVMVRSADNVYVAHLSINDGPPVRTASFSGRLDEGEWQVIGRAEEVRTRGLKIPLGSAARSLIWACHQLYASSGGSEAVADAKTLFRRVAHSRPGIVLRHWRLAPFELRPLNARDARELVIFASRYLQAPIPFLKKQLRTRWHEHGAAAGAFDRRGRLRGFCYFDDFRQEGLTLDGWWIRSLFVAPPARMLGLGERLIRLLCAQAKAQSVSKLLADVPASNTASRKLFQRAGFRPSQAELVNKVSQEWRRNGVSDDWVVFELEL
jgi:L-amino acid N-acyltransferase YncA